MCECFARFHSELLFPLFASAFAHAHGDADGGAVETKALAELAFKIAPVGRVEESSGK